LTQHGIITCMDSEESARSERIARTEKYTQLFRDAQKTNNDSWQQRQQVPKRLYHYTTITGLKGIVKDKAIRASDVRFMNDASELEYAARFLDDTIGELLRDNTDLRNLRPGFEYILYPGMRLFVACFCEKADLLSQWRGYGQGVAPVSLGFDLSGLDHKFGDVLSHAARARFSWARTLERSLPRSPRVNFHWNGWATVS